MTLRRWSFEKAARKAVRAEVSASESLREERRLARKAGRRRAGILRWMIRLLLYVCLSMCIAFGGFSNREHVVGLILLWSLGAVFLRAGQFHAALYDDPALIVFDYLPISDGDIFRAQWKRFLRISWWTLIDFTAAYSILLVQSGGGWHAMTGGLALGAVQWLFVVALAVCLVAFAWSSRFAAFGALLQTAALLMLFWGHDQPRLCAWLSGLAWCVPPLGWILQSLGISNGGGLLHQVLPALMCGTALALAPIAFQRARQSFLLSEPRHATDGRNPELIEFGERLAQRPDEARAAIQSRHFLAGFDWQKAGFAERFIARFFNARERVVAEFLLAANPGWTAQFRGALKFLLLALVVVWLFGGNLIAKAGALVFYAGLFGAIQFFASQRGFGLPREGGLQSPYYAIYPIGFWELARVVLKINLTKTVVALSLLLVVFAACGGFQSTAVWGALKLTAVALMAQPLLVIAAISPNTNDTQKGGFVFLAFALTSLMMAAVATFFFAARWWVVALAGFLAAAVSVFVLFLYGRWFNRSLFDLLPLRRTDLE